MIPHDDKYTAVLAYFHGDPNLMPADVRESMKDYTWENGMLYRLGKIVVLGDDELKRRIVESRHDSVMAGHPGQARMLDLVMRNFYWPGVKVYVNKYVEGCDTCQHNKNRHAALHGKLQPLAVPEGPWTNISYDMIVKLPKSKGFDSIFVVVDQFTKMAHFELAKESMSAKDVARMMMDKVWKLHGMPKNTVSDRGPTFASKVMRSLYKGLGIDPHFSTAYHPQTDGQTEHTNATLETYLRIFTNHRQNDWADLLSQAEFAYNNTKHASIGMSPFCANYGYNPTFTLTPDAAQATPVAQDLLEQLQHVHEELTAVMMLAQEKQKRFYDERHDKAPTFIVGDRVWLEVTNIMTSRPSPKLAARQLGPYTITEVISESAYQLHLLTTMKVHNVFNISLLMPYRPDKIEGRIHEPPPAVVVDGEEEYEVERVLDC